MSWCPDFKFRGTQAKLKRLGLISPIELAVNQVVVLQPDDEVELGFAKDGVRLRDERDDMQVD